ncbi:lysylphosphatidylglycerol synthase domain-containing protein [Tianweitania sediminis]|uniref:UPF0104 family protein n=1 Tax=Tianweitania sediminis TaxID=1502156 RepID=A0A8J7QZT8_9HYPH|nr:lysylphosphatidylglycerol synthase domain-containing protein [Tianweitania sediminis]MBP0437893.1 UPF0104 family protein [Tianweitania sediminis]
MTFRRFLWPAIGGLAVVFSIWLLVHELRGMSIDELMGSFAAISMHHWILAGLATLVAYAGLAGYDRVALLHLRRSHISFPFIALCSFTTYALSHNIGASVFSGAVVRYRAYGSKGLSAREIGVLVAFCSFTFALGVMLLFGLVLVTHPDITDRFVGLLPVEASAAMGWLLLLLIALYVLFSWLGLRPLKLGTFEIHYPRLPVVARQLLVAPIEILAAAAIIYFVLPDQGNPGYWVVLGIFLVSFSAALISHAPGGIGVLELVFITALPELQQEDVLAALLIFRLFYLLLPFVLALLVILGFERSQWGKSAPVPEAPRPSER